MQAHLPPAVYYQVALDRHWKMRRYQKAKYYYWAYVLKMSSYLYMYAYDYRNLRSGYIPLEKGD